MAILVSSAAIGCPAGPIVPLNPRIGRLSSGHMKEPVMSNLEGKVAIMASDESSYVTGIDLPVDGGLAQV